MLGVLMFRVMDSLDLLGLVHDRTHEVLRDQDSLLDEDGPQALAGSDRPGGEDHPAVLEAQPDLNPHPAEDEHAVPAEPAQVLHEVGQVPIPQVSPGPRRRGIHGRLNYGGPAGPRQTAAFAPCLSPLAAAIWRACDGRTTVGEIARRVPGPTGRPLEADVVRLTLDRLAKARLLEGEMAARPRLSHHSRRELLRKAAAIGGLSVLSLSAPTAALAVSCLPVGSCVDKTCANGPQVCCSGNCRQQGQQCGPGQGFTYVCL